MSDREILLKVRGVKTYFPIKKGILKRVVGHVKAVDDINLDVYRGETLGLVGESGCGKTTLGKSILQLVPATEGSMEYKFEDGYKDLRKLSRKELDDARKKIQIVFQDPYSSLNPRMTVSDIIGEPLDIHKLYDSKKDRADRIAELLNLVGLNSEHANRYAHEFSGGQRQRIGIARALAVNPRFIVCDEPVSALDVSIQAQIINTFEELQQKLGIAYLFIAHDLLVVQHMSRRIAVMYLGRIVEIGPARDRIAAPVHPYTESLISAIPMPDPETARHKHRIILEGDVPSPLHMPKGCPFRTRCRYATKECEETRPELKEIAPGHCVACHNR